jgi:L-alanine-DL-glutamate epimerase-like enolase superfamily enzyme
MVDRIKSIETYCLELPYRHRVNFRSVQESSGPYLLIRIKTKDGAEGLAECVSRPRQAGGLDPKTMAYQIETFFSPILAGRDPFDHNRILEDMGVIKGCTQSRALIDVALWDLKGKLLGQPVWRLLGGGEAKPVSVTWLVHGNTAKKMTAEAVAKVKRGFRNLKIKVWKRSMEDVRMVRDIRKAVGKDILIYCDANSAYTECEARNILSKLVDYDVVFLEEPCKIGTNDRRAALAHDLPIPVLGDQVCENLEAVHDLIKANAVGAVSVKPARTGITETLKIIALCEGAGIPAVIGTGSESRLGSMSRLHLRCAIPSLDPWPTETHFFEKLEDDVYDGPFEFKDGALTVYDEPGFGGRIDEKKLKRYRV